MKPFCLLTIMTILDCAASAAHHPADGAAAADAAEHEPAGALHVHPEAPEGQRASGPRSGMLPFIR